MTGNRGLAECRASLMPEAGIEPARPFEQLILNQSCLPFHHSGAASTIEGMGANFLIVAPFPRSE
jgi:hypothetical protein